ncbi:MAG TPA: winged helix-turn-helix domain-containing protein [Sphingomicrobium sp.]|nr:winged helix-turn-helix domain-containing protein [Sphingomicrobium sp.]
MLAEFVYEKGSWEVDTDRRELRAHGRAVPIGSRAFEIIEKLVRRAGRFVSKDELVEHVWKGAVVEENTLRVHIHAIRKALGPDRTLLKTDSGRGYRLIGRWTAKPGNGEQPDPAVRSPHAQDNQPRSNLPAATSALIGRESELQQLRILVSAYRVVTLTGAGGIGKTSLAFELARSVLPEFDDGVCQAELAALADPQLVPSAVAAALGLSATSALTTADGLARTIGMAKILLVLDNCEHLADAVARLIESIVRQCPNASVLVTSREVMRVDGERVFRVPPLVVPEEGRENQQQLQGYSAVELFLTRMQALDDRFSPAATDMAEVTAICRHLDGIPLAIEFAAARAATLGVRQVASGLANRFELLTSRRRSALPRHRTLRATLDWSYELLPESERGLLRALAIFAGPFTLDDAREIAAASDTIEQLSELVDKSLVIAEPRGSDTLYRLLETTRAYAFEKLEASGKHGDVARRHAEHYRAFFERIEPEWQSRPTGEVQADYGWRRHNLRAALDWTFSGNGDISIGFALTAAAVPFWMQTSSLGEWRRRVEQALAHLPEGEARDIRHEMKLYAALGASLVGFRRAEPPLEKVLQLSRELGDVEQQLLSLYGLWLARRNGTLDLAQQFLAIATTRADRLVADRMFGMSHHLLGNQSEARRHLERVVDGRSELSASSTIIRFRANQALAGQAFLARVLWVQGHPEQAMQAASAVVAQAIAAGHALSICQVLAYAGCPIALWSQDVDASQHYLGLSKDYTSKNELSIFADWNRCHFGQLDILRGNVGDGVAEMQAGLDALRASGRGFWMLDTVAELASGLGRAGRIEEAMALVDESSSTADSTDEKWIRPDFWRIRGELLRRKEAGAPSDRADSWFYRALEDARRQGALFLELRAATSLAKSLRDQGRPDEAAAALRPVYDRFTEGLELPFLQSARTLLAGLAR